VSEMSQPDFYIGFLEGSLRLMPNVVNNIAGHTIAWNVFVPAALLPMIFIGLLLAYPFMEQRLTGDLRHHHILDRPRNVPARTGLGVAVIVQAIVLLLAGADDAISYFFQIPLYMLVWFLRVGFFVFPVLAFYVTRHTCLALQRRDYVRLRDGERTGLISELPGGGYGPVTGALPEEERALMDTEPAGRLVAPTPRHVVPLPTPRRMSAQMMARLNHFYTRYQRENHTDGDGQGRYENAVTAQQESGESE